MSAWRADVAVKQLAPYAEADCPLLTVQWTWSQRQIRRRAVLSLLCRGADILVVARVNVVAEQSATAAKYHASTPHRKTTTTTTIRLLPITVCIHRGAYKHVQSDLYIKYIKRYI